MKLFHTVAHLFHPQRSNNHRPRLLHPEAMIALMLIALGFFGLVSGVSFLPGSTGRVLGYASSITPSQVLALTNEERRKQGLSELSLNPQLSSAALAKGQHMLANQYWAHTAPDGTQPWFFFKEADYQYQVAGENLARDFSEATTMTSAWMASPTHKANILSPRYQEIGVAVIDGVLQGYETTFGCPIFATPHALAARPSITQIAVETTQEPEVLVETAEPVLVPAAELTPSANQRPSQVLASWLVPQGSITVPPLLTPLQLLKAFFLALIMTICLTLLYDSVVIGHRSAIRMVGKNLAHILFLSVVAFLVILFKGGVVG